MAKQNDIDVNDLMERIIPYEVSQSKAYLKTILKKHPVLQEILKQKLKESNNWTRRAFEGEDVFFSINDSSWKTHNRNINSEVALSFIKQKNAKKEFLVIKFNIF